MRNFKKVIAGALALLMLALSVNVSFAAEEYTDEEAVVVAKVNAAGIMTGTDKGFEPAKSLTRAEAAAIIVRMKGISESAVKATAGTTLFKDVAATHWASGYVNQASNLGIVKGVSATEFAPEREVTIAEFTTMAVRALGAGKLVDSEGTWPTNYINFANEQGILDNVNSIYTAVSTRLQAATIAANTLESETWVKSEVKTNGEITYSKSGYFMHLDVLNISAYDNVKLADIDTKDRKMTVVGKLSNKDVADTVDMAKLKTSIEYDVWYDGDTKEIIGVWKAEDSKISTVEFTEITKVSTDKTKVTLKVNGVEKEYSFNADTDAEQQGAQPAVVYYNNNGGNAYTTTTAQGNFAAANTKFGTAEIDGSKINALYIEEYTNYGKVKEVKNDRVKFESSSDVKGSKCASLNIDEDDYEYLASKDGKDIKMSDLEEGDVIFYYVDGTTSTKYHVAAYSETVTGEIKSLATKTVKIGSDKYDYVTGLFTTSNLNDNVTAYLNEAGVIVMFEIEEDATDDYAVIKKIEAVQNNKGSITAELTLVDMNGTALETMELDLDKSAEELYTTKNDTTKANVMTFLFDKDNDGKLADDSTAIDFADVVSVNKADERAIGALVNYEIKSGKIVLTNVQSAVSGLNTANADEIASVTSKAINIGKNATWDDTYYITSATKILLVKPDSSKAVKVETVDFESLDNSTGVSGFVGDVDKDTKEVKFIVVDNNVKRASEATFAIILSTNVIKNDDDDLDREVEVIFQGSNDIKTLYYDSSKSYASNLATGSVVEISVKDTEITEVKKAPAAYASRDKEKLFELATAAKYVVDVFGNDTFTYATAIADNSNYSYTASGNAVTLRQATVAASRLTLSDDVIYVEYDEDGDYKVVDSIKELDVQDLDMFTSGSAAVAEDITFNEEDANEITKLVLYKDGDGNEEVVAIIFNK